MRCAATMPWVLADARCYKLRRVGLRPNPASPAVLACRPMPRGLGARRGPRAGGSAGALLLPALGITCPMPIARPRRRAVATGCCPVSRLAGTRTASDPHTRAGSDARNTPCVRAGPATLFSSMPSIARLRARAAIRALVLLSPLLLALPPAAPRDGRAASVQDRTQDHTAPFPRAGNYVGEAVCKDCHEEQHEAIHAGVHASVVLARQLRACETSHGPGKLHADGKDNAAQLITHPPDLGRDVVAFCGRCHAEAAHAHGGDLAGFLAAGKTCTSCHKVHEKRPAAPAHAVEVEEDGTGARWADAVRERVLVAVAVDVGERDGENPAPPWTVDPTRRLHEPAAASSPGRRIGRARRLPELDGVPVYTQAMLLQHPVQARLTNVVGEVFLR